MPRSQAEWQTFSAVRAESAKLWGDLVERHFRIRRRNLKWPSKARWQQWGKRRYSGLYSQSVQQIIAEFCEAVNSCRQLRKNGQPEAKYPWRKDKFRDVVYTNQSAVIRNGHLVLPHGKGMGKLRISIRFPLPGRLMEARLCMGHIALVCELPDVPRPQQTVIGVDLGVNTLIAATDGKVAVLISGREAKATVQYRNKKLAEIAGKQSKKTKGSRKWRRLQRRKAKMLAKTKRRIRDITHKATRMVADFFPGATCYVGKPFNGAAVKMGRLTAQQVSSVCNAKIIFQLDYKTCGAMQVEEAWTSQTCPVCGARNKCRRIYRCKQCGLVAPRDVIGGTNILCVGIHGELVHGRSVPNTVTYKYPVFRRVVPADTRQVASV